MLYIDVTQEYLPVDVRMNEHWHHQSYLCCLFDFLNLLLSHLNLAVDESQYVWFAQEIVPSSKMK